MSALLPGERLLWVGRPVRGLRLSPGDAQLLPLSLLWAGFVFAWEGAAVADFVASDHRTGLMFMLWGLPFCALGVHLILGRFVLDAHRRDRTFYAVSDRRVLIDEATGTTTLDLRHLPQLHIATGRRGVGTLTFGVPAWPPRGHDAPPPPPAFEGIDDVWGVQRIIGQACTALRTRSPRGSPPRERSIR